MKKAPALASRFAHWAGRGIVPDQPSPAETGEFASASQAAGFALNASAKLRGTQVVRAAAPAKPVPRAAAPDVDTPEGIAAFVLAAAAGRRGPTR